MTLGLPNRDVSAETYDNFDKPGYSLSDYAERWITPYGLGEMAVSNTRNFCGGRLNVAAVPFQTASDVGVNDHLKTWRSPRAPFRCPRTARSCSRLTSRLQPPAYSEVSTARRDPGPTQLAHRDRRTTKHTCCGDSRRRS